MRRLLTILQIVALMIAVLLIVGTPAAKSPKLVHAAGVYDSAPVPGSLLNFVTNQSPDSDTIDITITDAGGAPPDLLVNTVALTANPSTVYTVEVLDAGFAATTLPFNVTMNGPLTVRITCQAPTGSVAPFNTTLNVTHNDNPPGLATYSLSCLVNGPTYASTPTVNAVNPANPVTINTNDETPAMGTITINNNGAGDLRITDVQLAGDMTHLSLGFGGLPITVPPAGNTIINVNCNPMDDPFAPPMTTYNGTVSVTHDDQATAGVPKPIVQYPVACNVTGTPDMGTTPAPGGTIILNPTLVSVPSDNPTALNVTNNANAPLSTNGTLNITAMTFMGGDAGEFTLLTAPPVNIPAGNSANIGIRCTPTQANTRMTTLRITHNDAANPFIMSPTDYPVQCDGLPPVPNYTSVPADGMTIDFGTGLVGQPITLANALTITNTGSATLSIQGAPATQLVGGNVGDFTINTGIPFFINPGNNAPLSITCTPTGVGLRTTQLNVAHNDGNPPPNQPAVYQLNCTGSNTAPGYGSTPNPGNQININTSTNTTGTVLLNVQETGNQDLTVTGASIGGAQFSISSGGGGFTIPEGGVAQNIGVSCLSATAGTFNATLTVNHNASGSPATYPVQCIVTGASGAGYSSNPGPGSTITINTPLNSTGTSTIVMSETGTANLNITNISLTGATQISSAGTPTPFTITDNSGTTSTEIISCLSSTAGTFTATLTVTHNAAGSPAIYTINCTVSSATATTVQSATDTAATSTASAAVPATSVTQCPDNQVLSTPFPGNASGEYLLVNCFVVSSQGTVSITLALVLTNPSSFVGGDDISAIQASPANMLVYRQGSWFLTPSTYNAATQTYSFTSAAGANIYGFFFGTITEPVGAQSNSAFAGTTTGNVEDEIIPVDESKPPYAAIFSSLIVFFVAAIFFISGRRFKKENMTQAA